MRIFLGLTEICGYYGNLRLGLEQLGHRADFITLEQNPFLYKGETDNRLVRLARLALQRRRTTPRSRLPAKLLWVMADAFCRAALFAWAAFAFDVFIFGFGTSFLGGKEFRLLKLLGRRIICVYNGSDERPPYLSGYVLSKTRSLSMRQCVALAGTQKRAIRNANRYADIIVSHPLSAQFHERPIVPGLILGLAYDIDAKPCTPSDRGPAIRILHAPSHPEGKGSQFIRQIMTDLQAAGHPIEFVEITGRPNAEVLAELARCDFVVDEMWSDSPLAGLAAEAAFFGKPTVVGGYGWEALRRLLPAEAWPPSLTCHPDEFATSVERMITDAGFRRDMGHRAREFVRTRWNTRRMAMNYLRLIDGTAPEEWFYSPVTVAYIHGCGLSEERLRTALREYVRVGGTEALQLDDKPELKSKVLAFIS